MVRPSPWQGTVKRVFIYPSLREDAILATVRERDDSRFSLSGCDESCVDRLVVGLHNPFQFPPDRPLLIQLVGDVPDWAMAKIERGMSDRAATIRREPDALRLLLAGKRARVAWYGKDQYLAMAVFHAIRARDVEGVPYVVLGRVDDYERLEAAGLVEPVVADYGGAFPVASARRGWVTLVAEDRDGEAPARLLRSGASGVVRSIETVEKMNREAVRLLDAWRSATGLGGRGDCAGDAACSDDVVDVDVVLHTGYPSTAAGPLAFYDSTGVVNDYTGGTHCGGSPCRPDACPQLLDFRNHPLFTSPNLPNGDGGDCDRFSPTFYFPNGAGYDCEYDRATGSDRNYLEDAIRYGLYHDGTVDPTWPLGILYDLRVNESKNIRTVAIAAHWFDIPYRQYLFPHRPDHLKSQASWCAGDADCMASDADNDLGPSGSPCLTGTHPQNYNDSHDAGCVCDASPSSQYAQHLCDPSDADDGYEGESGLLDYFLANYYDDAGPVDYSYAHAGFGRLLGEDLQDAQLLVDRSSTFMASPAAPSGITAIDGIPGQSMVVGEYEELEAIAECRYQAADIVWPCHPDPDDVRCSYENLDCGGSPACPTSDTYEQVTHFLQRAAVNGEIVVAYGHNPYFGYVDDKAVFFFRPATGCSGGCPAAGQEDTGMVRTSVLRDSGPASYPPGVWSYSASSIGSYAYLGDCPSPPCTAQSSWVEALIPRGVLALHGGFGHAIDGRFAVDQERVFLKEIASSARLGDAFRIAINTRRDEWDQNAFPFEPFQVNYILVGDPMVSLPFVLQSCPDKAVLVAGKGDAPESPAGLPRVRGFRDDSLRLDGKLDFRPFSPADVYGNTIAAGNLDATSGDEIVAGRGNDPNSDMMVKTFKPDGTQFRPSFFPFPFEVGPGANVAVGDIVNTTGGSDIVAGRGPKDVFAPQVRVYQWDPMDQRYEATSVSFNAWGFIGYGVNIATGDLDADGFEDIVTGKGPGAYNGEVKAWQADGGVNPTSPLHAFTAFSGTTYGTNVGTLDADADGVFEIAAGKGPGTATSQMDSEVRVFRLESTWTQKASVDAFDDPFPDTYTADGVSHAGARPVGFEQDGSAGDELAVTRGPATQRVTAYQGDPSDFRGSNIRAWNVVTGTSWSLVEIDHFTGGELDAYEDDEVRAGDPSTRGLRVARISTNALSYPPQYFQGGDAPPGGPARPWESSASIARGLASLVSDLAPALFTSEGGKESLTGAFDAVMEELRGGNFAAADALAGALRATTAALPMAEPTRRELLWQFAGLHDSIVRERGNRAPEAQVVGGGTYRDPLGIGYRPMLWAGGSTDADSTPGTNDNIASYAWYDEAGRLLARRATVVPAILLEGRPSVTRRFTCHVVDAYGATAVGSVDVTVVGVEP